MGFCIRRATLARGDHESLVDFQESQISWLSSVGSSGQWGTQSIRATNSTSSERSREWIERSEKQTQWPSDEWCRAFIAETSITSSTSDNEEIIPLAGLVLDCKSPVYTRTVIEEQTENDPFVYVMYLISNRHAGDLARGSGSRLIEFAKQEVKNLGVRRLCVDCWRGNEGKLVKYYESQGFKVLGEFDAKREGKEDWLGCVLEMRL